MILNLTRQTLLLMKVYFLILPVANFILTAFSARFNVFCPAEMCACVSPNALQWGFAALSLRGLVRAVWTHSIVRLCLDRRGAAGGRKKINEKYLVRYFYELLSSFKWGQEKDQKWRILKTNLSWCLNCQFRKLQRQTEWKVFPEVPMEFLKTNLNGEQQGFTSLSTGME